MGYFIQQVMNGLALGSIYGLIAIGYTMVYGVIGMINFAHGDIFMLSAFMALITFVCAALYLSALPIFLALFLVLVVAMLLTSLWSWVIERIAYRPLRGSFRLAPLITAIGASMALSNFVQIQQGPQGKTLPVLIDGGFYLSSIGIQIQYKQILVIVVTFLLLLLFSYIVGRTSLGRAQRAVAQDQKMAALLGINVDRVIAMTFIMGACLAAVAGTLYTIYYGSISFSDGFVPGIKAFTAAVLGGIGSFPGAVLGAILIGLIEALWSGYFVTDYKDVAVFAVLAIVLIFLPSGLMGRPDVEKV